MDKASIFKIGKKEQDSGVQDQDNHDSLFLNIIPKDNRFSKKSKKNSKNMSNTTESEIQFPSMNLPINNIADRKKQINFNRQFTELNLKFKQHKLRRTLYQNFPYLIKSYSQGSSTTKEQFDDQQEENEDNFSFIQEHKFLYLFLQFSILIIRVFLIWLSSMRITFSITGIEYFYYLVIVIISIQTLLAGLKFFRKQPKLATKRFQFYALCVRNSYIIIYSILCQFNFMNDSIGIIILDIIYIFFQQDKCYKIYQIVKRILISSFLISRPIKLFQMITTILAVGHFFSICLYLITLQNMENNWTCKIQSSLDSWIDKYAYSLYFTYSTMLTVGYGDLTPTNKLQILVILFTQIFGVVVFAFIVNEIGSTLSDIRKQSESVEQDIGMIERLSKYYDLSKNLTFKARQYILTHGKQFIQEKDCDQNQIMSKLNENLRQAITNETNTKLIDKSIFFLCNWTKDFRREIAEYIVKTIIPPNEKIYQVLGKQKIYIVQKGKFAINVQRRQQNKVYLKKTIKYIKIDPKKEILNNTFGYVCTLTNRPINIVLDSSSFVVAYTLDTEKFIQIIKQNRCNYEYFMQLKTKVLQKRIPQSFQVPQVQNFREHFIPNRYMLVKRNSKIQSIQKRKKKYCRQRQKRKLIYYTQQTLENYNYQLNQITNLVEKQKQINFHQQFQKLRIFSSFYPKYNIQHIIDQLKCKYYTVDMEGKFLC